MPRTTKPAKASTSAMENVQDESSAHDKSPNSDQEQDPEFFFQPFKAQAVPNMFMPYIEGPKRWIGQLMMVYIIDSLNGT